MNVSVDAGILVLAERGRLSGASCLVDGPTFEAGARRLAGSGLALGLHLNFTEDFGQPGPCLPLSAFIASAYLRRLPAQALRAAVERQMRRFEDTVGRAPDYVDGHQHVHQLPGVREALLEVVGRYPAPRPWLRDAGRPRTAGLPARLRAKAWVIAALGASSLRRQARARGLRMSGGFLGVYDFQGGAAAYLGWMRRWLAACRDGDVLMCHPALGPDPRDALSAQRQAEFEVLGGDAMADLLARHHVSITMGAESAPEPAMTLSYHALADDFAVAPQLGPDDMRPLADAGFRSVIINRPDGEGGAGQPRSEDVMRAAREAGLEARYQPVVSGAITSADVAEFSHLLHELPGPVLAFCRSGARCTNLYQAARELEHHGTEQGQSKG